MNKFVTVIQRFLRLMSPSPPLLTERQLRALSHSELLSYTIQHASRPEFQQPTNPGKRGLELDAPMHEKEKKKRKEFDMRKYGQRLIALRLVYAGWRFHGFAAQVDNDNTVENHLFQALLKTRLVESRDTCEYSRAGRTDVGVSALGQVVGLRVRSSIVPPSKGSRELDYVRVINGNLPHGIRVLAWAPVSDGSSRFAKVYEGDPEAVLEYWRAVERGERTLEWGLVRRPGEPFSARFDAVYRSYKYFFVKGRLDVRSMQEAAAHFVGRHDFRNFCRIDENIVNFERVMYAVEIRRAENDAVVGTGGDGDGEHSMYYIFVKGQAFLWHQVRCMAAVLFDIGMRRESPNLVAEMLEDAKRGSGQFAHGRPQYRMASAIPLLLFECAYPDAVVLFPYCLGEEKQVDKGVDGGNETNWCSSFERADNDIAEMFAEQATKAAVLNAMLRDNDSLTLEAVNFRHELAAKNAQRMTYGLCRQGRKFLLDMNKGRHIPYKARTRDESVETKLQRAGHKSGTKRMFT